MQWPFGCMFLQRKTTGLAVMLLVETAPIHSVRVTRALIAANVNKVLQLTCLSQAHKLDHCKGALSAPDMWVTWRRSAKHPSAEPN